jgi:hypothetical protein
MLVEGPCEFADTRLLAAFRLRGTRVPCFHFTRGAAALAMLQAWIQLLGQQLLAVAGGSKGQWIRTLPTHSE